MIRAVFFFLALASTGCDVPGWLVYKNQSREKVIIRYEADFGDQHVMDTIVLLPRKDMDEARVMFGFGWRWTETQTKSYAAQFTRIEIERLEGTKILTNKEEIFDFFNSGQTRRFKYELRKKFK